MGSINYEEIISDDELKSVFKECAEELQKDYSTIMSKPLLEIYSFCKGYDRIISEKIRYTKTGRVRKNYREDYSNLQIAGTKFLFNLRTMLLNEEISFKVGAIDDDMKLKEKVYSQQELLNTNSNYLISSISQQAILLQASLEKAKNLDEISNQTVIDTWRKILELSENPDFDYEASKSQVAYANWLTNSNKQRQIFPQRKQDYNVYIGFAGPRGKEKQIYYYNLNDKYQYYNRGWLYEWFVDKMDNSGFLQQLASEVADGSFKSLVGKTDNVRGLRGGDVVKEENGILKQYQIKYGNRQIITFTSIKRTVNNIQESIKKYLQSITNHEALGTPTLAEELANEFIDTKGKLNANYNKTVNDIIKVLELNNS